MQDQDEEETYSMVGEGIEIIDGNPLNESKYQPGYMTDLSATRTLYLNISNLNKSHKTIEDITVKNNREESLHEYRTLNNNLLARAGKIICPEEHRNSTEEVENMKGLEFTKFNKEIAKALDATLEALKGMKEVDLKKLPLEVLENLILVLVNLNQESHEQIRKDNSLI